MNRILIEKAMLIAVMNDAREEISNGFVYIEDGKIVSVGAGTFQGDADTVIDASGMVVLPGFVNTHHHLYQTLTRNLPAMQNLPLFGWLTRHYEVWRRLTEEAVRISTKTGILELMKSGTTTTSDHLYLFPDKTSGYLIDAEIQAAAELGIRFQPTRGSMSLGKSSGGLPPDDTVQTRAEILADTKRLVEEYHDASPGAMTRISLAPCSPFSVTPELMKETAVYALDNGLQMHTHLAETVDEENYCLRKYGRKPCGFVDDLGWMNEQAWFAHCVHLSDEEITRMGNAGVGVSHCPTSNMRLGSGIAPVREMLDAGIRVSLGVDGSASNDSGNMLMEIRNAMLLSRLRAEEYWLSARDVLSMATRGGAATLGRTDIGELTPGKQADIALFNMNKIEYAGGMSDPLAALVFSVRMSPVDYLIVNGKILIAGGKSEIDETALIALHNECAGKLASG